MYDDYKDANKDLREALEKLAKCKGDVKKIQDDIDQGNVTGRDISIIKKFIRYINKYYLNN